MPYQWMSVPLQRAKQTLLNMKKILNTNDSPKVYRETPHTHGELIYATWVSRNIRLKDRDRCFT